MKKLVIALALLVYFAASGVFAATSYDNNEYQRKSRMLSASADRAFDEGDYDAAAQYAREAEENARLSAAFIEKMLAKASAEKAIQDAKAKLAWARDLNAEKNFPSAFAEAEGYVAKADAGYQSEEYVAAEEDALLAIESLSVIREIVPLPAFYTVDSWDPDRDCLWNIAKNPAIYGNPYLWEKLYEANRRKLKRPDNPHLLMPGMVVTIPSISGELREGMYDPNKKYEPFKK